MAADSDDFFTALEILLGLTERCAQCKKAISPDDKDENIGCCWQCTDEAYEEYYRAEAEKAQREWEWEEYERLRNNGQV